MKKINTIFLKNFKGYSNNTITLANYNILAGKNSTGKTTIFEAIELFLKTEDMSTNNFNDIFKGKTFDTFMNKYAEIEEEEGFELGLNTKTKKFVRNQRNLREISTNVTSLEDLQIKYIRFNSLRYSDNEDFHKFNNMISRVYDDNTQKSILETTMKNIFDVHSVLINKYDVTREFYEVLIDDILLEDVGYGVRFVFDLLIQLLSENESLILLENPELHLHPHAQSKFIEELIKLCQMKEHQIILETHSDHVINAFRKMSYIVDEAEVKAIYIEDKIHEIPLRGTRNIYPSGFMDQAKNDILEIFNYENNN